MDTIQQIPEQSPQVDVNVTLNLLPFGKLKFHEMLVIPEELIAQPGGFSYPEGTSVFEIVPSPEPMMVVTY